MKRLYLRIWLTVVMAVAVLTLILGWMWQTTQGSLPKQVVVSDGEGHVIGSGLAYTGVPANGVSERHFPPAPLILEDKLGLHYPEFELLLENGKVVYLHMQRPTDSIRNPLGFLWTLILVSVAVALGAYPAIRHLTSDLEALHAGVQRWGHGDLNTKIHIKGKDEVASLAKSFNWAAEQVRSLILSREKLLSSQKALLANASHELRSPLARIRMGLELMHNAPTAPNTAMREELSRNINELDDLIEEILLASRLDTPETELPPMEAVDLVGLCAEECARTQAAMEVRTDEMQVPGVTKLLRRVIRNLLENARRYGGSDVLLHLYSDGQQAVIRVIDSGPGVPEELQERIFEAFYRLPGASEKDGGVGLGLALVKSIVGRHQGHVQCYNRIEGGACFEVRLPLHSPSALSTPLSGSKK